MIKVVTEADGLPDREGDTFRIKVDAGDGCVLAVDMDREQARAVAADLNAWLASESEARHAG